MAKKKNNKKVNNRSKTKNKLEITENLMVECPWCTGESSIKDWTDNSYKYCTSREMKRAFRGLTAIEAWMQEPGYFFKCPICGNWCGGYNLKITNSDDDRLKNLGNKPVIEKCSLNGEV